MHIILWIILAIISYLIQSILYLIQSLIWLVEMLIIYLFAFLEILNWPVIAALILIGCIAYRYEMSVSKKIANSPYEKLANPAGMLEKYAGPLLVVVILIWAAIIAINSGFGVIGSFFYWFAAIFIVCVMLFLPICYTLLILRSLSCYYAMTVMSKDKQKIDKAYTDNKIKKFMHDKEIFKLKDLLEVYKSKSFMPENHSDELEKVNYLIKSRFDKYFTTTSGDLSDASYDTYCMPLDAYDKLKKEFADFLQDTGPLDIFYITEKTIGIVPKAYFAQKALNDLVDSKSVVKYDAYYMSPVAYGKLRKKLDDFLRGSGAVNIDYMTENAERITGFVSNACFAVKAYFIQKALNDLVGNGSVVKCDAYYMSLIVYDELKKEIDVFLCKVGTHDIVDITEKTTGFVPKAYFIQKALNDLANSGSITKMEIGSAPGKELGASEIRYIYRHKNSQRPMKSTEIYID